MTPMRRRSSSSSRRVECLDARQSGLALQLRLQRRQAEGGPEVPGEEHPGLGRVPVRRVRPRNALLTASASTAISAKGLPYLDGYKAFFVKSGGVVPGMLGGQFDVEFRGRTPSERDQLLKSADHDRWVLHEGPWATVDIVIFNTTHKPFDDPRVRRALSLAIDRWGGNEALSKITFVKATGGFLRPGYEYALPESEILKIPGYERDIEKSRAEARRLLKEAGVENLSAQAAQPDGRRALYARRRLPHRPVEADRGHRRALPGRDQPLLRQSCRGQLRRRALSHHGARR